MARNFSIQLKDSSKSINHSKNVYLIYLFTSVVTEDATYRFKKSKRHTNREDFDETSFV